MSTGAAMYSQRTSLMHSVISGDADRGEARHYAFYMWQAGQHLARPGVARIVRGIMDRFYSPVGSSHQPDALARWVSGFLFDGEEGRRAAEHIDRSIARLPGFSDASLLGDWLRRNVYH